MTQRAADPLALIVGFDALRGARILIRAYRISDTDAFFAAVAESRERLRRWDHWPDDCQTRADAQMLLARFIGQQMLCDALELALCDHAGTFLGGLALFPRNWSVPSFEIGYWLRQSAERHGYAAEATRLLTDFAFDQLGANRIEIRCDARNTRSAALARRLGFRHEVTIRHADIAADGSPLTQLVFARLATDGPLTHE